MEDSAELPTVELGGELYVVASDLAKARNTSRVTVYRAISDGRIPARLVLGRQLVPVAVARAWQPASHGGARRGASKKKAATT